MQADRSAISPSSRHRFTLKGVPKVVLLTKYAPVKDYSYRYRERRPLHDDSAAGYSSLIAFQSFSQLCMQYIEVVLIRNMQYIGIVLIPSFPLTQRSGKTPARRF